jgi:hypothetical protein
LVAGAAYLASRVLVPDALPVADSDQPQWDLQLAFVLGSIEFIGLGGNGSGADIRPVGLPHEAFGNDTIGLKMTGAHPCTPAISP